ncbi:DUF503 domain-containing protein [Miniphocaeibacter halophilus]|uniref:DUF503 domain-containing protein n=1 Tax=Miniphocaeibacter halophilus TaxID=2931922 RepID=A0AC61MUE7_9FIRM|nr:DUF503 domain-containing protein [Miniphocaeibacter halophilus]QQK08444.1 DUF503 domain-containing protein [Miniphocaeibacter halophilus]
MTILLLTISLYAPWVHSLKEKRSIVKSLIAKLRNNYNISVVESDNQNLHQKITISLAAITFNSSKSDSLESKIIAFIEENTEASIINVEREIR